MSKTNFLFVAMAIVVLPALSAQTTSFTLAEYLSPVPGDTLEFQNLQSPKAPNLQITFPKAIDFKGYPTIECHNIDGSFHLLRVDAEDGYFIHQIHLANGHVILLSSPLKILPAQLHKKEKYTFEASCVRLIDGIKSGFGKVTVTTTIIGNDSAITPLQNFANCLVLNTNLSIYIGEKEIGGYSYKQWYARRVGLIKFVGEYHLVDQMTRVATLLDKATIDGRALTKKVVAAKK